MVSQGQCLLSAIPVRSEGKSQAEIVTQLLYGETYSVKSKTEEWIEVKIDFDGYEGWISANQFSEIKFVPKGVLFDHSFDTIDGITIPMGGSLPNRTGYSELPTTELAQMLLGSPYLWGGKTFMGIDCSGFMQVIHKVKNIALPRDASQQVKVGEEISFEERQSGDLAFFVSEAGNVTHVGLLLSTDEIIHAAGSVRIDTFNEDGIVHVLSKKQTHSLFSIRRLK